MGQEQMNVLYTVCSGVVYVRTFVCRLVNIKNCCSAAAAER